MSILWTKAFSTVQTLAGITVIELKTVNKGQESKHSTFHVSYYQDHPEVDQE
jgi:hypothetical protein